MKKQDPFIKPIFIGKPSPLTAADLPRLHEGNRSMTSVQRIRASHHKIARLAAYGITHKEIAATTGYTRERVSLLLGSPAMKELVAIYMEKIEEREAEQLDAYLALKLSNMVAAERHIADAIAEADDVGEILPINTMLRVSADAADRLGYAKKQSVTVNHEFGAALERAIARSGKTINLTPVADNPALPRPDRSPASVLSADSSAKVEPRPLILRRI